MGTFAGVFIGLIMFLVGTMAVGGITDSSIQSLITGVLVSMATSCCGIWLLILSHRLASEATNQIDMIRMIFMNGSKMNLCRL